MINYEFTAFFFALWFVILLAALIWCYNLSSKKLDKLYSQNYELRKENAQLKIGIEHIKTLLDERIIKAAFGLDDKK